MSNYSDMPSEDREISALSLPPHSTEAEQSVLGGLMLENSAWDRIADVVSGEDFYRHEHRLIFRAIANLINESRPADVITVQESLERNEELEAAGGFNYLITLAQNTLPISAATPKSCANVPSCASLPKSARKLHAAPTIRKGAMQASFWTRQKTKYSKLPKVPPNPNKAFLRCLTF